jgi:hypothetical protein
MERSFKLRVRINTGDPGAVEPVLRRPRGIEGYRVVAEEFEIDAEINGESARELNRSILSELRHACRRTGIRAAYSHEGSGERSFDHSLRSTSD